MRKLVIAVLVCSAHFSYAKEDKWGHDWRVFGNFENAAYYIDANSLKKMPNGHIRLLEKMRFKKGEALKIGVRSGSVYQEIDCINEKQRHLDTNAYASSDLTGPSLKRIGKQDWTYPHKTTKDGLKMKMACSGNFSGFKNLPETEKEFDEKYGS